ncbi:MAG TPA: alpha/beta hydrolase [Chloroflexota bacterium]|nr:alpha/beta hydrolase [Chloroflexota bacterium]
MVQEQFTSIAVDGEDIRVHFHEAGPVDGPPLIFMQTGGHGTSAGMCWYRNFDAFERSGYRVLAPDAPGFGQTEASSGRSVNALHFLAAFMDHVDIRRAHLIGNSMGSMTITGFAIEQPDRVASAILTGGEPRADTPEAAAIVPELGKTPRLDFVREMLSQPEVRTEHIRKATADFFYDADHPAVEEVAAMRLKTLQQPGMLERARADALQQVARGRSNYGAEALARIQAPTYLIYGRDERHFFPAELAPALIRAAAEVGFIIPNCRTTLLPHCGHWPQIEAAETFNALALEFLRAYPI